MKNRYIPRSGADAEQNGPKQQDEQSEPFEHAKPFLQHNHREHGYENQAERE